MAVNPTDSPDTLIDDDAATAEHSDERAVLDQEWLGARKAEDYEDSKYDLTPEEEIERERYSAELWESPNHMGADKSVLFPDHLLTPEEQIQRDLMLGEAYRGSWELHTGHGLGFPSNEAELEPDEIVEQKDTLAQIYHRDQGLDDNHDHGLDDDV